MLFLATLQNGLSVSGVASYWQQIITGAILLVAILLDRIQRRVRQLGVRASGPARGLRAGGRRSNDERGSEDGEVYAAQFGISADEAEQRIVETFGARFAEELFAAAGGSAWDDAPLTRRDRSLVVVRCWRARRPRRPVRTRRALENGATPDELEAVVALAALRRPPARVRGDGGRAR